MKGKKVLTMLVFAVIGVPLLTCACAAPPPVQAPVTTAEVIKDIEYGKAGEIPLLLDIYVPETPIASPMPAIIWIHGGGWRGKDKYPNPRADTLSKRGFFMVSINYRLSGIATYPAAIEDCKCSIRWLRANAEKYNVDPDRIGVGGGSAGGHLAMLVGCADETAGLEGNGGWEGVSSRVQAICSLFGISDFVALSEYEAGLTAKFKVVRPAATAFLEFLDGTVEEKSDDYRHASPINHVTKDDPPLIMIHGELDTIVPISQSETMYQAYQQVGADAELVRVTGADHGFQQLRSAPISPSSEEIEQITLDFFIERLVQAR